MKNILPAILSIIIGFALTFFSAKLYKDYGSNISQNNTGKIESTSTSSQEKNVTNKKRNTKVAPKTTNNKNTSPIKGKISFHPNSTPYTLQNDYATWNTYKKENLDLMSSFIPIDDIGNKTNKGTFLSLLRTGAYMPIKLKSNDNETYYRLFNLNPETDIKTRKSIKSASSIAYHYFKMEGKKLPDYNFVDLNGKSHNKIDTEGKLLVLKCWFINCKICVEEFPELNTLVDRYKDNNGVAFVSLAFDEADKLKKFLETKDFKYPVIPLQKKYMAKKLKVKQYPTHLIIDENGIIIKMVNNVKSLISELDKITGQE